MKGLLGRKLTFVRRSPKMMSLLSILPKDKKVVGQEVPKDVNENKFEQRPLW